MLRVVKKMKCVSQCTIFYNLEYNGKKILYTYKNLQDTYAGFDKEKQSTTCSKIE